MCFVIGGSNLKKMPESSQTASSSTTTGTSATTGTTGIPLTNFNYYFLLKTENIEPLIDIVNRINKEINDNQNLIHSLCLQIDNHGKFPDTIASSTNTNASDNSSTSIDDPLRYLLEEKYNITRSPNPSLTNTTTNLEDYKQSLINDITQLRQLQQSKNLKNRQFLSIIEDYEQELNKFILPNLRNLIINNLDSNKHQKSKKSKTSKDILLIRKQFFMIEKLIYEKYEKYIIRLWKLIKFIKLLNKFMIKLKQQQLKQKQLEMIQEVKELKLQLQEIK